MRRSSSTLMWCGKLRILRRRDLSLVGGRLRLTTPTEEGSPSDELLEREPQSVTDSVAFCLDDVDGEVFVDSLSAASSSSPPPSSSSSSSTCSCSCSCSADWTSIMDGSAIRRRQLASAFTNSLLLLLPLPPLTRIDESVPLVLVLLLLAMVLAIADGLARASSVSSLISPATVELDFDFNSLPLSGSSSSPTGLVRTMPAARRSRSVVRSSSPED